MNIVYKYKICDANFTKVNEYAQCKFLISGTSGNAQCKHLNSLLYSLRYEAHSDN